jgi:hypothetical protein
MNCREWTKRTIKRTMFVNLHHVSILFQVCICGGEKFPFYPFIAQTPLMRYLDAQYGKTHLPDIRLPDLVCARLPARLRLGATPVEYLLDDLDLLPVGCTHSTGTLTLRTGLLQEFAIETMAHTGPRAFPEIQGEKVNTTAFVLRKEPDASRRTNNIGTYFRLVHEPDAEAKRLAFEKALAALKQGNGR